MKRGDFSVDRRLIKLLPISFIIGILASFVALFLIQLINVFTNLFFFGALRAEYVSPAENHLGAWVIAIPAIGGLIIGLMARFGSERIRGHGIPEALEAILFGKSIMEPKVAVLKPLSSAISIGSGGPFGAEGPIIMTGGAFGSLIAQLFHLTASERKTLLVAGAAAGMSAVFAAPMAAILLAVELLLFEWRPRSLIPVAIASITASALRPFLLGTGPVFPLSIQVETTPGALLLCCLIGVIAGLFSTATSNLLYKVEDSFHRLSLHWMWWPALGGLVVGVGGYLQPRTLGVGYDVIQQLLQDDVRPMDALALLSVKSLIWVISLGSGTSGGVLAPLLIMGCGLGVVEAAVLPGAISNLYPLISMAAVMGGMMRSPFAAVFFAIETTHDLSPMIPVLTATIAAYATTTFSMRRSILTEKVARRGYDIFREYGIDPLEVVRVDEVMTPSPLTITVGTDLKRVQENYFNQSTKFRGYPVVDELGKLKGIITAADLLQNALARDSEIFRVGDLPQKRMITCYPHESCREAAERMALNGIGRLPVISAGDGGRLLGIITRSDLLKPRLTQHQLEIKRERILSFGKRVELQ